MTVGLRSIDLFAGCGGLSLGLHVAGWEGLFAIERDPMAFDTLRSNLVDDGAPYAAYRKWPAWLPKTQHDINALVTDSAVRRELASLRGEVDLVAGGPPCQGFSVGGARNGHDERNLLVHRQLEVVDLVRPAVTIVENVEGITRPFRARPGASEESVAEAVSAELRALGYDCTYQVIDASAFGVPQVRRRTVIAGVRADIAQPAARLFKLLAESRGAVLSKHNLPQRTITAKEALDDLHNPGVLVPCPDSVKYSSSPYRTAHSAYAKAMRVGARTGSVPDSHRFTVHGERILDLYRTAHATQPKGRLSKEFLLANGTKKDKKVLIDPSQPVSTITTHPDEFIHYDAPRNVTVREMARLQSFPDDFRFYGRYTINGPRRRFDVARCSQVGNAVPPLLGEALGLAIAGLLDGR